MHADKQPEPLNLGVPVVYFPRANAILARAQALLWVGDWRSAGLPVVKNFSPYWQLATCRSYLIFSRNIYARLHRRQVKGKNLDSITFGKSKLKYLFVKTRLHVLFLAVQDSAQFNIRQGASCAASV